MLLKLWGASSFWFTTYEKKDFCLKNNNFLYNLQEKLSSCLSSNMVRRWFVFEWFYSAIDYPWFAKREFMEYLNHVGLGNIPRLTRVEWSVIKRYEIQLWLLWFSCVVLNLENSKLCNHQGCIWNCHVVLVFAVPLANPAGFLNTFYVKKGINLNSIGNQWGNITLNCGLVLGMDFQLI